jgi:hypothetical protein
VTAAPGASQLQPTAPAAALARIDSTKSISTQLQTARSSSSSRGSNQHHLRIAGSTGHAAHRKSHSSSSSSGRGCHSGTGRSSSSSVWAALVDHCVVAGEGAYVEALGWFAVRVCVLPSQQLSELPAMLRVSAWWD